ncbi:MAG: prepilin peptidase [Patescibacteria group bacterium]
MPLLVILLTFLLGLIIGSFLNVVICRLPKGEQVNGRSRCPHCASILPWFDLIPLLSFVALRGKCRHCRTSISWQYPAVEFAAGALFALSATIRQQELGITPILWFTLLRDLVVISALLVTFVTDLRFQLIYDAVILIAACIVFPLNVIIGVPLLPLAIAGIIGVSFFGLQYIVSRGRWIGAGDIYLGGFIGIAVSFPQILLALACAYLAGAAVALPLLLSKHKTWQSRIAFGTFLSIAGIVTLFWGNQILNWYLNLILT